MIGILTLPLGTNYGGILQCYALQSVLEKSGHEVIAFEPYKRWRPLPWYKRPYLCVKKAVGNAFGKKNDIYTEGQRAREWPVISQNTERFIEKYIHTYNIRSAEEIPVKDLEAIVVGSDQIWRPRYLPWYFKDTAEVFLSFLKDDKRIKRVSYAVSFGTENWEYSERETARCRELIKLFDGVSVRESGGVRLCREYLDFSDAVRVLDPTMLLRSKDYMKLMDAYNSRHSSECNDTDTASYVLTYFLDENSAKTNIAQYISGKKGLQLKMTGSKTEHPWYPLEERIQPPVENWLRDIYNADFVVTDSFHGCVFSIIFGKPFVAVKNRHRGMDRFSSLLGSFGLESRLVEEECAYGDIDLSEIDYKSVHAVLDEKRQESIHFLSKYI